MDRLLNTVRGKSFSKPKDIVINRNDDYIFIFVKKERGLMVVYPLTKTSDVYKLNESLVIFKTKEDANLYRSKILIKEDKYKDTMFIIYAVEQTFKNGYEHSILLNYDSEKDMFSLS